MSIDTLFSMRIAIYQPRYFPQLHYFNRMFSSDVFVLLESAQFTKSLVHITAGVKERQPSYQSTTPIKSSQGVFLLGIPIKHSGYASITKTEISYDEPWAAKHLVQLKLAYQKSPFFSKLFPQIQELLSAHYENLAVLNKKTIFWGIASLLEYELPVLTMTETQLQSCFKKMKTRLKQIISDPILNIPRPEGLQKGTEWTTEICKKLQATEYLHGETAQVGYMDLEYYTKHGITPVVQKWQGKKYSQQFVKQGFLPNLSILDLLFNVSPSEARSILNVS